MGKPKKVTASTKAPKKKAAAAPVVPESDLGGLRGEREQLATIRPTLVALTEAESKAFLATHSSETCREKAKATKARDILRIALTWARVVGANPTDPAVHPKRARWFIDNASAVADVIAGQSVLRNPSTSTSLPDAHAKAVKLSGDVRSSALRALGDDDAKKAELRAALTAPAHDARAEALRATRKLLKGWIADPSLGMRLSMHDVDEATLDALEAGAKALDKATATREAAKQGDKDGPELNEAEGRLIFSMSWLWQDFKRARKNGHSKLTLPVSPAILRALGLGKGRDDEDDDEDPEGGTGGTV